MPRYQLWDTIVRTGHPGGWESQLGGTGEKERGQNRPWGFSVEAAGGCPGWGATGRS